MNIEEFSFDLDEKSVENFKKAINYDEIEARHKRFMNGTETIDDLINGILHYRIKNDDDLDLDVVEFKYYQKMIDLYLKEKEKNNRYKELLIKVLSLNSEISEEKEILLDAFSRRKRGVNRNMEIKGYISDYNAEKIKETEYQYNIKGRRIISEPKFLFKATFFIEKPLSYKELKHVRNLLDSERYIKLVIKELEE